MKMITSRERSIYEGDRSALCLEMTTMCYDYLILLINLPHGGKNRDLIPTALCQNLGYNGVRYNEAALLGK